ncbi:MAG: hypothetical protein ACI8ZB_003415 [Desulforhopalus sp.]|jgi:hypothetical protein
MQGFLLHSSATPLSHCQPSLPHSFSQLTADQLELSPHISLSIWGNAALKSDIYISLKKEQSLLIMNGYFTETEILPPSSSQQAACEELHRYIEKKCSMDEVQTLVDSINGSFSFLYVSINEMTTWTITDRLASRPLWVSRKDNELRISSHAVAVARHANLESYSPGSLASYLLYANQVTPTQSLFAGVECQKEGTIVKSSPGQQSEEETWYNFEHVADEGHSVAFWAKCVSESLVNSASRLLKTTENPVLFLSGGVDSRLVGAALIAAGGSPLLCTLGDSYNLEVKIATAVAKAFECRHKIILRDDEWYLRVIENAMYSSNGMFSWNHSHFSEAYLRLQKEYGVDAAILGDLSEAFSKVFISLPEKRTQLWTEEEFVSEFDTLPLANYRPENRLRSLSLLNNDFRVEAEKQLDENIRCRYRRVTGVSKDPQIVGDFFFRWQTTQCLPTFQMFNDVRSAGPERNLMFDNELHKLLETMPSNIRNSKNLGSKVVHKILPKAAWVPNANSLIPLHFPGQLHSLAEVIKPSLGKIRRKLFSNSYQTTASWPHLPLLYAGNDQWKKRIEERIFDSSLLPKDVFEQQAIEACWKDFCGGDLTLHSDVERLLGLAELRRLL